MVKDLHAMNAHVLISIWPKFDLGTENFNELEKAGALYPTIVPSVYPKGQQKWYDPFNAAGRKIYWKQMSTQICSASASTAGGSTRRSRNSAASGVSFAHYQTAAGPGAEVYNAYPLMHTTGIYQGQRAQTDKKRVVILTRSAYAGQQRNGAITWSGDIRGNWDVFAKQIPAGLNFSVSGIPYWNTDIGGFFGGKPTDKNYQELFTRWFQFGAFYPMFRVHGTQVGQGNLALGRADAKNSGRLHQTALPAAALYLFHVVAGDERRRNDAAPVDDGFWRRHATRWTSATNFCSARQSW